MGLLTIGAFARAARLSPKALRLYDRVGLLRPTSVNPTSGYRLYSPDQLEQAKLIAALRRLGMPLSRIGDVLRSARAADEVAKYWQDVEAELRARRELASALIERLLHYAAASHQGLVRESNQDCAYASDDLLAVADGFGPHGHLASAAAIDSVKSVDASGLLGAVQRARRTFRDHTGTTLTAVRRSGSRLAVLHIGDSRAYLLRDGHFRQLTRDHTHPRRPLLSKALYSEKAASPDLLWQDTEPGDRYLLCSDGLYTSVPDDTLADLAGTITSPAETVHELVELANRNGGTDNIACAVADVR